MRCFYHSEREAAMNCSECGKPLCRECADLFQPPVCAACAGQIAEDLKKEMIKKLAISVVLMVLGVAFTGELMGIFLAGIPFGWSILNRITPAMFIWMPLAGWAIYFGIKLVIAFAIGMFALPYKIYKYITDIRRYSGISQTVQGVLN